MDKVLGTYFKWLGFSVLTTQPSKNTFSAALDAPAVVPKQPVFVGLSRDHLSLRHVKVTRFLGQPHVVVNVAPHRRQLKGPSRNRAPVIRQGYHWLCTLI